MGFQVFLGSYFSSVVSYSEPPLAANVNERFAANWAFTREERNLLRHAIRNHEGWTYLDVPSPGKIDVRYFCHKNDIQNPIFCVQKVGRVNGKPVYAFRVPWDDAQKTGHFPDLLQNINMILKKKLLPTRPALSLVHNG